MRCLILGSTGPIGRAIAREGRFQGHEPIGVSRTAKSASEHERSHLKIDRRDVAGVLDAVRDNRIDCVIDVVAYTLGATVPLFAALEGRVSRYVLLSSSDVYLNYGIVHGRDTGYVTPLLDETSDLRASRFPYRGPQPRAEDDPQKHFDDYDKIPIEDAVRASSLDWTILRLPMVYGPGDPQTRFRWAIAPMLARKAEIDVPPDWLRWVTTYGYVDNVAAAIVHAAAHAEASRQVFNVGDYAPVSHEVWLQRWRNGTQWAGDLYETNDPENALARAARGLNLAATLALSTARLTERLGFFPPMPIEECIVRTILEEHRRIS